MTPPPATVPRLFPVLLVNFIDALGFSIVIPFLVFLVTEYGGNGAVYGVIGAAYPACQLLAAPVLGRWSDVYGRRRILLVCELGTLAGWALFGVALVVPRLELGHVHASSLGAFTVTLPLIIVLLSRAVDGITGGNISVANAYVADISTESTRGRNFGRMNVAQNLGVVIGPALAGVLGAFGLGRTMPILITLGASLVATLVVAFYLTDPNPTGVSRAEPLGLRRTLGLPGIPRMLGLYLLTYLGFNFYYAAFPVHAAVTLHWDVTRTGIYFAGLSLLMVVVQGPVLAIAEKRFSRPVLILLGSLLLAANFFLLLSPNVVLIATSVALFAVGNGLMWPSVVALLSSVAGERFQGAAQGLAASSGSAASIAGLVAGGLLYQQLGAGTFALSGCLIVVAGLSSIGAGPPHATAGRIPM